MKRLVLALWLIATPVLAQQITAFPAASTPLAGTEQIYLVQAGQPRQTTVGQLPLAGGPFLPLAGGKTVTGPVTFSGFLSATGGGALSGTWTFNGTPTFTGTPNFNAGLNAAAVALGTSGSLPGVATFANLTSGALAIAPPATGALGIDLITIPIPAGSTDIFALLGTPESFTAATTFTTTVVMSGLPTACTGIVGSKKLANVSGTLTVC